MGYRTIILKNTTGTDITIVELASIVIPGAGQLDITGAFTLYEVQKSVELDGYIQAGDIIINDGSQDLNTIESQNYLVPMAVVSTNDPNTDIEENTAARHNQVHNFAGTDHNADTKTNVESKISDIDFLMSNAAGEINSFSEITDYANVASEMVWLVAEDGDDSNIKKKISLDGAILSAGGMIGQEYVEDDTPSVTSQTTYQTKLTLNVTADAGEIVRIGYSMEYNAGSLNKAVDVRFYNSTDAIDLGENIQKTNSDKNYFSFAGFHYEVFDTSTTKTFLLQYRQDPVNGAACTVRNASLEAFRFVG